MIEQSRLSGTRPDRTARRKTSPPQGLGWQPESRFYLAVRTRLVSVRFSHIELEVR